MNYAAFDTVFRPVKALRCGANVKARSGWCLLYRIMTPSLRLIAGILNRAHVFEHMLGDRAAKTVA